MFLGAGASRACGLPDMSELECSVKTRLDPADKDHLSRQLQGRNLEQALSRIRRIAALLEGETKLEALTGKVADRLDRNICQAIVEELSTDTVKLKPMVQMALWAARTDYHWPLEVFTVNYDLLVETAFETLRVPYFDGFVGNLKGHFHTDLVEGTPEDPERWLLRSFVRLWKLHGSVNWAWDSANEVEVVRLGSHVPDGSAAAIYPSDVKYDESRRVPFLVLQDRFRRALAQPETLTLVTGYSFGDEHLNEVIFDATAQRPRSEIIVFCHSDIPDVLKGQAQQNPNLQAVTTNKAILGGRLAHWKSPEESPSTGDFWKKGKFTLGDFRNLAAHLALSSPQSQSQSMDLADKKQDG